MEMDNTEIQLYQGILDHLEDFSESLPRLSARIDDLYKTHSALELKLVELSNATAHLLEKTESLVKSVEGNSKPGLKDRVSELENESKTRRKITNLVYGTLGVVLITQVWNWIVEAVNLINKHNLMNVPK